MSFRVEPLGVEDLTPGMTVRSTPSGKWIRVLEIYSERSSNGLGRMALTSCLYGKNAGDRHGMVFYEGTYYRRIREGFERRGDGNYFLWVEDVPVGVVIKNRSLDPARSWTAYTLDNTDTDRPIHVRMTPVGHAESRKAAYHLIVPE